MVCKPCLDGGWECGPVEGELCQSGGDWELVGTICVKVFLRKGPGGKCQVRFEPDTGGEGWEKGS